MNQMTLLRESRSKHTLRNSDAAAKQLRVFTMVQPISEKTIDYLERWQLHNELFGDDIVFVGVLEVESEMRFAPRKSGDLRSRERRSPDRRVPTRAAPATSPDTV